MHNHRHTRARAGGRALGAPHDPTGGRRTQQRRVGTGRSLIILLCALGVVGSGCVVAAAPALAGSGPVVTGLSRHQGPYWGATQVIVYGRNFVDVQKVRFGYKAAYAVHVFSSTKLSVLDPEHAYDVIHVRVVTSSGTSAPTAQNYFRFTHPTMDTPIMGGLTARQEQRISARVRAAHRGVYIAPRRNHWTAAMGFTAAHRARSWLGLPYSWAGGNAGRPTYGVCAHNGGDMDCHVVGFDCSGLALYTWSPYEQLIHYAATQHRQAGRFHPAMGQLVPGDLVFFSGYIANGIGHVAVYTGHGMVIQAAQSGTQIMRSRLVDVIAESGVYRGATRPMSTGQQAPGPRVLSLTTQLPLQGGYVRITGRHLGTATAVRVGATMVYSFVRRAADHLVVKVPAHSAGRVSIRVSNPWGTAERTLVYVAPPQIASLSPNTGPTSGETPVTIYGRHLTTVGEVTFGGSSVDFQIVTAGQLVLTTPAHAAGSVQVILHSPFGNSNAVPFTFATPVPGSTPAAQAARTSARAGPTRSSPLPRVRRAQPAVAPTATPRTANAASRFFADRVGQAWFLVGRLLVEHPGSHVRGCLVRKPSRLTDCVEWALRLDVEHARGSTPH